MGKPQNSSGECLPGVLSKIGVLRTVLARVPTEVSMKENNRKSTFASTVRSTPILESTPREHSPELFWGFPISGQSPRPGSSLNQNALLDIEVISPVVADELCSDQYLHSALNTWRGSPCSWKGVDHSMSLPGRKQMTLLVMCKCSVP